MTEWKKVYGSQDTKPEEFDDTTSNSCVYQRKNIELVTGTDSMTGDETQHWEYDERELTKEEYQDIMEQSYRNVVEQNRADIEYIAVMSGVEL